MELVLDDRAAEADAGLDAVVRRSSVSVENWKFFFVGDTHCFGW